MFHGRHIFQLNIPDKHNHFIVHWFDCGLAITKKNSVHPATLGDLENV